jgi:cytochrome d ubiquinol oxidase subunit II
MSLMMGLLALALCAYLAAVFLANETQGALREDFRDRALFAGTFTVGLSALLLVSLRSEAPHLWAGLLSRRAAPVFAIGIGTALLAGWFLRTRQYRLARAAAALQITALLGGWMLAQHPYLIYPDVTVQSAAAPAATLAFLLWSLPIGAAVLVPSLWLLFRVFKGETLTWRERA